MKKTYKLFIATLFLAGPLMLSAQINWWNRSVAYEIFVRSFYDSNADGIGDFNGLTQKLDYLKNSDNSIASDLDVNLLWLMPVNSSPSYHGYDVTNYLALNPQYGTLTQFRNMLNEAHKRGIKVVMDFVMNHTSDQHPWFIKSAANDSFYRNFYVWNNNPGTQTGPWGQQVWYSKNGSKYYAVFWSGMPDLNYNYQPVKDSMFAAAKYWIKEVGVDGFRLDAAMYLFEEGNVLKNHPKTPAFWREFNDSCKSWNPNAFLVGEVWDNADVVAQYNGKLDMCFNFNLASANLYAAANANPYASRISIEWAKNNYDTLQFATFLTNHDQDRVYNVLAGNLDQYKVAASILLTQPGLPFVYYGEEIGMSGAKPDEDIRRPMQWSNTANAGFTSGTPWRTINSNYPSFNVATELNDNNSLLNHYRKLIKIRSVSNYMQTGLHQNLISTANAVHTYTRGSGSGKMIVMVNTSAQTQSKVQFNVSEFSDNSYTFIDLMSGEKFNYTAQNNQIAFETDMAPYQTRILQLNSAVEGIQDLNQNRLTLYPNPANGNTVYIQSENGMQNLHYRLLTLSAQEIIQGTTDSHLLDISGISNGMYLLQVEDTDGAMQFIKLQILH